MDEWCTSEHCHISINISFNFLFIAVWNKMDLLLQSLEGSISPSLAIAETLNTHLFAATDFNRHVIQETLYSLAQNGSLLGLTNLLVLVLVCYILLHYHIINNEKYTFLLAYQDAVFCRKQKTEEVESGGIRSFRSATTKYIVLRDSVTVMSCLYNILSFFYLL